MVLDFYVNRREQVLEISCGRMTHRLLWGASIGHGEGLVTLRVLFLAPVLVVCQSRLARGFQNRQPKPTVRVDLFAVTYGHSNGHMHIVIIEH